MAAVIFVVYPTKAGKAEYLAITATLREFNRQAALWPLGKCQKIHVCIWLKQKMLKRKKESVVDEYLIRWA